MNSLIDYIYKKDIMSAIKFIQSESNIYEKSRDGNTPLYVSVETNQIVIVEALLRKGVDINEMNENNNTVLHLASHKGCIKLTNLLLKNKANVNIVNRAGRTPLHVACLKVRFNVCSLLLKYGANINLKDYYDILPFEYLIQKLFCINNLIEEKKKERDNMLLRSVKSFIYYGVEITDLVVDNNKNIYQILEEKGFYITLNYLRNIKYHSHDYILKKRNKIIESFYDHLIKYDKIQINRYIRKGVDLNIKNKDGIGALHILASSGKTEYISLLLKAGANIEIRNNNGSTPLYIASSNGHVEFVETLLLYGADVNSKTNNKDSSIHTACYRRSPKIIKCLLDYKADPNDSGYCGITPLQYLFMSITSDQKVDLDDVIKSIEYLLSNGANPEQKNNLNLDAYNCIESYPVLYNYMKEFQGNLNKLENIKKL